MDIHTRRCMEMEKYVFGDHISVSFLVVILYYSYARCCHWEKQGNEYTRPLYIMSYNYM